MASGRSDVLRRRGPGPHGRIRDTRALGLIPGLSNRDARRAFDARVAALRAALDADDTEALGRGLGEALQLGLWRARKLTGFEALSEDVVGLAAPVARAHATRWAESQSASLDVLLDASVALWLRAEVVLLSLCPQARAWIDAGTQTLTLQLPSGDPADAARVLAALARTARELERVMEAEGAVRRGKPGSRRPR